MRSIETHKNNTKLIHYIVSVTAIYYLYYIFWRAFFTLNESALLFSLLMLFTEIYGIISFYLFTFMTWKINPIPDLVCPDGVSIDIFIPTFNEEVEVLEATLAGCAAIDYPHLTYLLDDGNRPEIKKLSELWNCRYISRKENIHAKAGNLNNALKHSSGDFIVVIDADTVPQPELITHTLGYFEDEKVAIVQLPQEFYNKDSFQHAKNRKGTPSWHEQTLFYRVIQPGKNRINSAFWCGSPSVIRRSAIEEIGGIATETITEDIHTSIRLHSRGFKIIYHDELLAYGIAPQTLNSFSVQRLRWAQGTMQLLRTKENPLWVRGFTLAQRLSYFASMATYFDAYQKLIYLFIPVIILLTGKIPFSTSLVSFLLRWIPYYLLGMISSIALGRGSYNYFEIEKYNFLKIFTFIRATFILIFPKELIFKVTPKNIDNSLKSQDRQKLRGFYIVFGIALFSVIMGVGNLFLEITAAYTLKGPVAAAFFWSAFNMFLMIYSISGVIKIKYKRKSYRFPFNIFAEIKSSGKIVMSGIVMDLSYSGMKISVSENTELTEDLEVHLYFTEKPLVLKCKNNYKQKLKDDSYLFGIEFGQMDMKERKELLGFLFITAPHISNDLYSSKNLSPEELLEAHLKSGIFNNFL